MIATPGPRKSFPLSWEELHRDAKALAGHLLELGPWKGMVAVTRGGLAPAAIVARALDIRLIETVCVIGYEPDDYNPQQANEVTIIKAPARVDDGEGWLVVDDLVDTGRNRRGIAQVDAESAFRRDLCQAAGLPAGRHLRHRNMPGRLDLLSMGKWPNGSADRSAGGRLINR